MDFQEQLRKIRNEKHLAYLKHISKNETKADDVVQTAVTKIQRFARRKFFQKCANEEEIASIPPIYRIRINITEGHINEYTEENISPDLVSLNRFLYQVTRPVQKNIILFRYCFDIRKLYPARHQILELFGHFYFLQAEDHCYIDTVWKKVNGITNESIIYLNNFEYQKSLSKDKFKHATS